MSTLDRSSAFFRLARFVFGVNQIFHKRDDGQLLTQVLLGCHQSSVARKRQLPKTLIGLVQALTQTDPPRLREQPQAAISDQQATKTKETLSFAGVLST